MIVLAVLVIVSSTSTCSGGKLLAAQAPGPDGRALGNRANRRDL